MVFSGIFVSLSSRSKILSLGNENKTSFTFAFHSFIRIFAIRIPKLQNMIDFLDLLAMEAIEDANKEREKEQWEDDNEDNDEEED